MIWLRIVLTSAGTAFVRMLAFALEGAINNACAGAVFGLVLTCIGGFLLLALYLASFFIPAAAIPPTNPLILFWLIFIGTIGGTLAGGVSGAVAMGLSGIVSAFSPCPDLKEYFGRSYQGLLWSSSLCLFAGVISGFMFYLFSRSVSPSPAYNWEAVILIYIYGTYQLGAIVGALAPQLPLWMLHRLGEIYGRVHTLIKP